jgi:hypothetical protein
MTSGFHHDTVFFAAIFIAIIRPPHNITNPSLSLSLFPFVFLHLLLPRVVANKNFNLQIISHLLQLIAYHSSYPSE